jgi:Phage phiEco32-like COOH.NH2 ligase-type 2
MRELEFKEVYNKAVAEKAKVISFARFGDWQTIEVDKIEFINSGFRQPGMYYSSIWYSTVESACVGNVNNIRSANIVGSDPEFFFMKDGKVVPSVEIIKQETNSVKRDGFQGELNPSADSCREVAGNRIARAIRDAAYMARQSGATLTFNMSTVIEDDVWKRSPSGLKRFGCNPTQNVHEKEFKRSTGMREKFRSAGGHVHIQLGDSMKRKVSDIIKVMDIVVGNTCVLIDRDPANARRRKIYGRAGEHRIKPYGVEYRVPSNFWLKHYKLWSMIAGLARNSVGIVMHGHAEKLFALYDFKDVRKAINENDFDLALKNFDILSKFMKDNAIVSPYAFDCTSVDKFRKWATSKNPYTRLRIKTDEDSVKHWKSRASHYMKGFESFIKTIK